MAPGTTLFRCCVCDPGDSDSGEHPDASPEDTGVLRVWKGTGNQGTRRTF